MTAFPEEVPGGFNYKALTNLLMHGDELALMALRKHMAARSMDPRGDGQDAAAASLGLAPERGAKLAGMIFGRDQDPEIQGSAAQRACAGGIEVPQGGRLHTHTAPIAMGLLGNRVKGYSTTDAAATRLGLSNSDIGALSNMASRVNAMPPGSIPPFADAQKAAAVLAAPQTAGPLTYANPGHPAAGNLTRMKATFAPKPAATTPVASPAGWKPHGTV